MKITSKIFACIILAMFMLALVPTVSAQPDVVISCDDPNQIIAPGEEANFTINIYNRGEAGDIQLQVSGVPECWSAYLSEDELYMAENSSAEVYLYIEACAEGEEGDVASITVDVVTRGIVQDDQLFQATISKTSKTYTTGFEVVTLDGSTTTTGWGTYWSIYTEPSTVSGPITSPTPIWGLTDHESEATAFILTPGDAKNFQARAGLTGDYFTVWVQAASDLTEGHTISVKAKLTESGSTWESLTSKHTITGETPFGIAIVPTGTASQSGVLGEWLEYPFTVSGTGGGFSYTLNVVDRPGKTGTGWEVVLEDGAGTTLWSDDDTLNKTISGTLDPSNPDSYKLKIRNNQTEGLLTLLVTARVTLRIYDDLNTSSNSTGEAPSLLPDWTTYAIIGVIVGVVAVAAVLAYRQRGKPGGIKPGKGGKKKGGI